MQGVSEARGQRRNEAALLGLHTWAASGLAPQAPQHVQPGTRLPERRRTRGLDWLGDSRYLPWQTSIAKHPITERTTYNDRDSDYSCSDWCHDNDRDEYRKKASPTRQADVHSDDLSNIPLAAAAAAARSKERYTRHRNLWRCWTICLGAGSPADEQVKQAANRQSTSCTLLSKSAYAVEDAPQSLSLLVDAGPSNQNLINEGSVRGNGRP